MSSWTSAWSLGATQMMLEIASASPSSRVFICWIRPNLTRGVVAGVTKIPYLASRRSQYISSTSMASTM